MKGGLRSPKGGRPKGTFKDPRFKMEKIVGTRLPQWMLDWLYNQKISRSKIVEEALLEYYHLTPPSINLETPTSTTTETPTETPTMTDT